jgi:hypothetical protein
MPTGHRRCPTVSFAGDILPDIASMEILLEGKRRMFCIKNIII